MSAVVLYCGLVLVCVAVSGHETPPTSVATSCGLLCPIVPAPPLVWTVTELVYMAVGVGTMTVGATGIALAVIARRGLIGRYESRWSRRSSELLRGAQAGVVAGTGFIDSLAAAGSSSLVPNGGGLPILVGGATLLGSGAVLLWRAVVSRRGRRAADLPPTHLEG